MHTFESGALGDNAGGENDEVAAALVNANDGHGIARKVGAARCVLNVEAIEQPEVLIAQGLDFAGNGEIGIERRPLTAWERGVAGALPEGRGDAGIYGSNIREGDAVKINRRLPFCSSLSGGFCYGEVPEPTEVIVAVAAPVKATT